MVISELGNGQWLSNVSSRRMTSNESTNVVEDPTPFWYKYMMFMLFGAGSGWFIMNALFLELVTYTKEFGFIDANRFSLGVQFGAVLVPCVILIFTQLRRSGHTIGYVKLILLKAMIDVLVLTWMSFGIESLGILTFVKIVAGGCAWLIGIIHLAHITMYYENRYIAAYWGGDAAVGVMMAIFAIIENPAAGEARRFGPGTFYKLMIPFIFLSMLAFNRIEQQGIGKLSVATRGPAYLQRAASPSPSSTALGFGIELAATGRCLSADSDSSSTNSSTSWFCFPAGAVERPLLTTTLVALGFCLSFTCFGIGDSLALYACRQNHQLDKGAECYFNVTVASFFGMFIGSNLAGVAATPSTKMLFWPGAVYSLCFILLCLASLIGGNWATAGSESSVGFYIVVLSTMMYGLMSYVHLLRQRLIQVLYKPGQWEGMNQLIWICAVIANVSGTLFGSLILPRDR